MAHCSVFLPLPAVTSRAPRAKAAEYCTLKLDAPEPPLLTHMSALASAGGTLPPEPTAKWTVSVGLPAGSARAAMDRQAASRATTRSVSEGGIECCMANGVKK